MKRKAVLITGASGRLGFILARKSLALGYSVVAHYRSSRSPLEAWVRRTPSARPNVHFVHADLTDPAQSPVVQARSLPVSLVGLVNNASTYTPGTIDDYGDLARTLDIDALTPLRLANEFSETVRKGWIINMTDAHICRSNTVHQNYRIAKRLLTELTLQMALSLAPGIRVNAIAPGAMLKPAGSSRERFNELSKVIPLGRTGIPADLEMAYDYLVNATYVTGQTLYVDGGWAILTADT